MRIAYFDCSAGASGDMILGALVSAGLDFGHLKNELGRLGLGGYTLSRREVLKAGLAGTHVIVELDEHGHSHRRLKDIEGIIERSGLKTAVKSRSIEIFRRLARAEALVHDQPVEQVHFHEVGAVDAIVDIVGAVVGLDALGIERIYSSPLHVGSGTVQCAHGTLPVPAPATAELIKEKPFYSTGVVGELLTPTGAAILTTLASGFGPIPPMRAERIGYGAGTRELSIPNLLRLFVGPEENEASGLGTEHVAVLETSIDDMSPQIYEHVMNKMFDLGAFEVFMSPVQMKKNRPGTLLTVICGPDLAKPLAEVLMRETTTIGLRWRFEYKLRAPSEVREVQTEFGIIRCKIARIGESIINAAPEYDDCRRAAAKNGIPLKDVMEIVKRDILAPGE